MENNKRTIAPLSSEKEIQAAIQHPAAQESHTDNDSTDRSINSNNYTFASAVPLTGNIDKNQGRFGITTSQAQKKSFKKKDMSIVYVLLLIAFGIAGFVALRSIGIFSKVEYKNFTVKADDYTYSVQYYSDAKDVCLHDCSYARSHHIQRSGRGGMGLTIAPSRISEVSPSQMEAHKSQMCGYGRKNIQIESPGKDLYGCVDDSGSLATQVTIDDFLVDVRLSGNELTDYNTIKDQLEAIITSIRVNELSS